MNRLVYIALTSIILSTGCRRIDNVTYAGFEDIASDGWDPAYVLGFSPWPVDSVMAPGTTYDVNICVRYSARFRPTPLHLIVMSENGDTQTSDTITIRLEPPASKPGGRGSYGVYEVTRQIASHLALQNGYLVELRSLTAKDNTRGILNIGVQLVENGPDRSSPFRFDGFFN